MRSKFAVFLWQPSAQVSHDTLFTDGHVKALKGNSGSISSGVLSGHDKYNTTSNAQGKATFRTD